MVLEKFTSLQRSLVILNLAELVPHRDIARHLQKLYRGIKPDGMTQEEYEEIVINRCKDYASNKDRKPYHEIKKGRDKRRDDDIEIIKWALQDLYFLLDRMKREEIEQIQFAEISPLCEKTGQLWSEIYDLFFRKDDGDEDEDLDTESEDPGEVGRCDTEWQKILQKRTENGNGAKPPNGTDPESHSAAPASDSPPV